MITPYFEDHRNPRSPRPTVRRYLQFDGASFKITDADPEGVGHRVRLCDMDDVPVDLAVAAMAAGGAFVPLPLSVAPTPDQRVLS